MITEENTEFIDTLRALMEGARDLDKIKSGECRKNHLRLLEMEREQSKFPGWNQGQYETVVSEYAMRVSKLVSTNKITYEEATGMQ